MTEQALEREQEEVGLGERFIDTCQGTFESIGFMPEAGFLHYRIDADAVRVLAIGHLSRSPRYWTRRIDEVDEEQPD